MFSRKRKLDQCSESVPNFAVLKLKPDTNCVQLFQYALSLGIVDISFVSHPREYFSACEVPLIPSRTPNSPDLQIIQSTDAPVTNGGQTYPIAPIATDVPQLTNEVKVESPAPCSTEDSPVPDNVPSEQLNTVLSTLFGKKPDHPRPNPLILSHSPPRSDSPPPSIPGNGQIMCKLCGISVSCRKITNLSIHTLKLHCPIPLWKCPSEACEFDHADYGRVRSHIRHQHAGFDGLPVDNRTVDTVRDALKYLKHCYPSVDWVDQHSNAIYMTEPSVEKPRDKERSDGASGWDKWVINDGNRDRPMECSGCGITVPLNKRQMEDHIRLVHKANRYSQCVLCDYAHEEEWRVRVHHSMAHVDLPLTKIGHGNAFQKPHLFISSLFPRIAESLPPDSVDDLMLALRPNESAPILAPVPAAEPVQPIHSAQLAGDAAVQSILMHMFPTLSPVSPNPNQMAMRKTSSSMNRVERVGGKIVCSQCNVGVESKRTMLVSHAKSHVTQRQWQCPHCETSAAFHSKLKLHIINAHKSEAEPLDHYSSKLENKWLLSFRQSFPQFAQQCYVEEWKFRSKQQQHYSSQADELWGKSQCVEAMPEQPRRSILVEETVPDSDVIPQDALSQAAVVTPSDEVSIDTKVFV